MNDVTTADAESPLIGKHTFETLTTGMYSDPLDCLREYVQNSVDSIEEGGKLAESRIDFTIDPEAKTVLIGDSGLGIPSSAAAATLRNVGRSDKAERSGRSRGFRGIGRLGGLAYCERLIFRTQAAGEDVMTTQEWDCRLLRRLLRPDNEHDLTMADLIARVSSSAGEPAEPREHGFFEVELRAVTEPLLLDVRRVKHHLSMVAPVAFDASGFKFWDEVDRYLSRQVSDYVSVNLLVNGEAVFKPYTDSPLLSRAPGRTKGNHRDSVKDIDFMTLTDLEDGPLAYAWIAKTDLKGLLEPDSGVAGIRLRAGNIGIGDGRALVECFPKSDERFAPYLIGEIHTVAPDLIPNARRDGFEHGRVRDALFEACARQIAAPYRKKIREASANRSVQREVQEAQSVRTDAEEAIRRGLTTDEEREAYKMRLGESQESIRELGPGVQHVIEELKQTAEAIAEAPRMVDVELANEYRKIDRDRFQGLFDILHGETSDQEWARRTIKKMVAYLKKAKDCSTQTVPTARVASVDAVRESEKVEPELFAVDTLPGIEVRSGVRIRFDLLPNEVWGSNLRSILSQAEWDRLRIPVCEAAGNVCQICGEPSGGLEEGRSRRPDCHERWAFEIVDGGRSVQRLVQLVALCPTCHQTQHFGHAQLEGFEEIVSERVAKLNGWSDDEVNSDKSRAGDRYKALRGREWDLDLSVLSGLVSIAGCPDLVVPAIQRASLVK
jgi:hypothetical protein